MLWLTVAVCLSLLGTWAGTPEMQWQPRRSTIMSVLISIQAMILNEKPWENEPGAEVRDRSSQQMSDRYNRRRQALTIRFAMMDWLMRQDMRGGLWRDVVGKYFELNHEKIIATAEQWAKNNREIENYGGETTSMIRTGYYQTQNLLEDLQKQLVRNSKYMQEHAAAPKVEGLSLGKQ